jgi:hypothetical protein
MRTSLTLFVLLSFLITGCDSAPSLKGIGDKRTETDEADNVSAGEGVAQEQPEILATPATPDGTSLDAQAEPEGMPRGISIHSTGVKKMEKRYRYFFGVYNNTDQTFVGQIIIRYDTDLMQAMTFGSDKVTIYAHSGGSFYFDRRTAPYYTGEHGDAGVRRFSYELTDAEGKQIASGAMALSTRYSVYP